LKIISAVHPNLYGTRFVEFMKAAIRGTSAALSDEQNKFVDKALARHSGSFIQK
jgi:hypothetical protein